jgi:hypothetical protein
VRGGWWRRFGGGARQPVFGDADQRLIVFPIVHGFYDLAISAEILAASNIFLSVGGHDFLDFGAEAFALPDCERWPGGFWGRSSGSALVGDYLSIFRMSWEISLSPAKKLVGSLGDCSAMALYQPIAPDPVCVKHDRLQPSAARFACGHNIASTLSEVFGSGKLRSGRVATGPGR